MIITKTPVRISFLGGGTDYPEYFERHPGSTLGTAINRYAYINVTETHPIFDYKYRISYKQAEVVDKIDEIQHPSVKACLKFLDIKEHLEIHYQGDWPARTGLGSSSTFTIGLLNTLYAFLDKKVDNRQLAKDAIYVEREIIKERVGWQDQIWAAFGGMARIDFHGDQFTYKPIEISKERKTEFHERLLMFYTGITRFAHDILDEQIEETRKMSNDSALADMNDFVSEGVKILESGKIADFGPMLHENWKIKKSLSSKISNDERNDAYDKALKLGATGGKILGAGGGGFLLLFAQPENHKKIISALKPLTPMNFDFCDHGSKIIFNTNK